MSDIFTFQWIFVSWIITLIIHHHTLKRAAISDSKDGLIDLLNNLSMLDWLKDENFSLLTEEKFNTKISRIRWRIKQLNELSSCIILSEDSIDPLLDFDVEKFLSDDISTNEKKDFKFQLQNHCDDLIDLLEENYFNKVLKCKTFIFKSSRSSWIGLVLLILLVVLISA
ncbi:hypothetical protein HR45_08500 [Shewanella mangrovi]|uniref:Uncharacterized protein n=1 Tax=Shewanella mangrovi TaxID=1515746 RepID=A0A094JDC2_9GAMM|nr:hypothetical protein [Shewanella mangrovi]KFZ37875.1 hypothetical protein HR45_08500 [Shewanella mangrovi]